VSADEESEAMSTAMKVVQEIVQVDSGVGVT